MAASFPTSPTNGQIAEVGGRYFTYNSTKGVWEVSGAASAPVATAANITVTGTANISTLTVTSNLGLGTASPTVKLDVVGEIKATQQVVIGTGGGTYQAGSIYSDANYGMIFRAARASPAVNEFLWANSANTPLLKIDTNGYLIPGASATYDLGTSAARWRNIYTSDLHLSNGIGDYTIVEGEEDLFLVNNKSGKHYKFALIEVDPNQVPPKQKTGE